MAFGFIGKLLGKRGKADLNEPQHMRAEEHAPQDNASAEQDMPEQDIPVRNTHYPHAAGPTSPADDHAEGVTASFPERELTSRTDDQAPMAAAPPPESAEPGENAMIDTQEESSPGGMENVAVVYDLDVSAGGGLPTTSPSSSLEPVVEDSPSLLDRQEIPSRSAPKPLISSQPMGELSPQNNNQPTANDDTAVPDSTSLPGAGIVGTPGSASTNPKVSQTFKVPAPLRSSFPARAGLKSPMAARSAKVSQTFRVDSPAVGRPVPAPVAAKEQNNIKVSQTFRVTPPSLKEGVLGQKDDGPAPMSETNDVKVSQTFRVSPPSSTPSGVSMPPPLSPVEPDADEELQREGVELPLEFMLRELPPALRGPAWNESQFPDTVLELSMDDIAHVLKRRHMRVSIDDFRTLVPEGWVADDATGEVEVPLVDLISFLPQSVLDDSEGGSDFEQLFADEGNEAPEAGEDDVSAVTGEAIGIPCKAALEQLEEGWRGPGWQPDNFPNVTLSLSLNDVRTQLATGRVCVSAAFLRRLLPEGILADVAEGDVELDLQTVVMAMAPDALAISQAEAEDVQAVAGMPDFFVPASASRSPSAPTADSDVPGAVSTPTDTDNTIELPCSVILPALSEEMRGGAWQTDAIPDQKVSLPQNSLLRQLGTGKITIPIDQIRTQLPDGWFAPTASGSLDLNLADVVASIPPEKLALSNPMQDDVAAASELPAFFKPLSTVGSPVPSNGESADGTKQEKAEVRPSPPAGDTIDLPISIVLGALREEQRGPEWNEEALPEGAIPFPRQSLLTQLSAGCVRVFIQDIRNLVPTGWLAPTAKGTFDLDLASVVATLPGELLAVNAPMADGVEDVAAMPDFFKPSSEAGSKTHDDAAQPTAGPEMAADTISGMSTEPVTRKDVEPEEAVSKADDLVSVPRESDDSLFDGIPEWSGVEANLEQAPRGVDINAASVSELTHVIGVGDIRAKGIIDYRKENGPFSSIYELANVPGIGPSMFRKMTGLSLAKRTDRHQILTNLLALGENDAPLIQQVVEKMTQMLRASGGLATTVEGIALATTKEIGADAARYAALGSRFFFQTKRHLERFVESASDCIILPGSKPPLMVLAHGDVVFIFTLRTAVVPAKRLNSARRALREISWLMSRRAVVTNM